jgi:hypothetical protein
MLNNLKKIACMNSKGLRGLCFKFFVGLVGYQTLKNVKNFGGESEAHVQSFNENNLV